LRRRVDATGCVATVVTAIIATAINITLFPTASAIIISVVDITPTTTAVAIPVTVACVVIIFVIVVQSLVESRVPTGCAAGGALLARGGRGIASDFNADDVNDERVGGPGSTVVGAA
jgi:CBS domain containing-hemolysin-like protein